MDIISGQARCYHDLAEVLTIRNSAEKVMDTLAPVSVREKDAFNASLQIPIFTGNDRIVQGDRQHQIDSGFVGESEVLNYPILYGRLILIIIRRSSTTGINDEHIRSKLSKEVKALIS